MTTQEIQGRVQLLELELQESRSRESQQKELYSQLFKAFEQQTSLLQQRKPVKEMEILREKQEMEMKDLREEMKNERRNLKQDIINMGVEKERLLSQKENMEQLQMEKDKLFQSEKGIIQTQKEQLERQVRLLTEELIRVKQLEQELVFQMKEEVRVQVSRAVEGERMRNEDMNVRIQMEYTRERDQLLEESRYLKEELKEVNEQISSIMNLKQKQTLFTESEDLQQGEEMRELRRQYEIKEIEFNILRKQFMNQQSEIVRLNSLVSHMGDLENDLRHKTKMNDLQNSLETKYIEVKRECEELRAQLNESRIELKQILVSGQLEKDSLRQRISLERKRSSDLNSKLQQTHTDYTKKKTTIIKEILNQDSQIKRLSKRLSQSSINSQMQMNYCSTNQVNFCSNSSMQIGSCELLHIPHSNMNNCQKNVYQKSPLSEIQLHYNSTLTSSKLPLFESTPPPALHFNGQIQELNPGVHYHQRIETEYEEAILNKNQSTENHLNQGQVTQNGNPASSSDYLNKPTKNGNMDGNTNEYYLGKTISRSTLKKEKTAYLNNFSLNSTQQSSTMLQQIAKSTPSADNKQKRISTSNEKFNASHVKKNVNSFSKNPTPLRGSKKNSCHDIIQSRNKASTHSLMKNSTKQEQIGINQSMSVAEYLKVHSSKQLNQNYVNQNQSLSSGPNQTLNNLNDSYFSKNSFIKPQSERSPLKDNKNTNLPCSIISSDQQLDQHVKTPKTDVQNIHRLIQEPVDHQQTHSHHSNQNSLQLYLLDKQEHTEDRVLQMSSTEYKYPSRPTEKPHNPNPNTFYSKSQIPSIQVEFCISNLDSEHIDKNKNENIKENKDLNSLNYNSNHIGTQSSDVNRQIKDSQTSSHKKEATPQMTTGNFKGNIISEGIDNRNVQGSQKNQDKEYIQKGKSPTLKSLSRYCYEDKENKNEYKQERRMSTASSSGYSQQNYLAQVNTYSHLAKKKTIVNAFETDDSLNLFSKQFFPQINKKQENPQNEIQNKDRNQFLFERKNSQSSHLKQNYYQNEENNYIQTNCNKQKANDQNNIQLRKNYDLPLTLQSNQMDSMNKDDTNEFQPNDSKPHMESLLFGNLNTNILSQLK